MSKNGQMLSWIHLQDEIKCVADCREMWQCLKGILMDMAHHQWCANTEWQLQ